MREFTDMKVVSPFFNLEERNAKKGFDIIAVDSNMELWIIESKAGELGKYKNSTNKVRERINAAKNDLDTRLNEHNSQLWLNAMNSVRSALDDTSEKNTILNILRDNKSYSSCDKNVVLYKDRFSKNRRIVQFYTKIEEVFKIEINCDTKTNISSDNRFFGNTSGERLLWTD